MAVVVEAVGGLAAGPAGQVVPEAVVVLEPAVATNSVEAADSPVAADSAEAADTSRPAFSASELPLRDQSAFLGTFPIPEAGRAPRHLQRSEGESGSSLAYEEDSVVGAYPEWRRILYGEGDERLARVL